MASSYLWTQDVELEGSDVIHTSEYAYLASGSDSSLCHTTNFQWKRDAFVYIVVSVKNLGVWVQHLIRNMEHVRQCDTHPGHTLYSLTTPTSYIK